MGLLQFLIGGLGFKSAAWIDGLVWVFDRWPSFLMGLCLCVWLGFVAGLCLCVWLSCWFDVCVCVCVGVMMGLDRLIIV